MLAGVIPVPGMSPCARLRAGELCRGIAAYVAGDLGLGQAVLGIPGEESDFVGSPCCGVVTLVWASCSKRRSWWTLMRLEGSRSLRLIRKVDLCNHEVMAAKHFSNRDSGDCGVRVFRRGHARRKSDEHAVGPERTLIDIGRECCAHSWISEVS